MQSRISVDYFLPAYEFSYNIFIGYFFHNLIWKQGNLYCLGYKISYAICFILIDFFLMFENQATMAWFNLLHLSVCLVSKYYYSKVITVSHGDRSGHPSHIYLNPNHWTKCSFRLVIYYIIYIKYINMYIHSSKIILKNLALNGIPRHFH